MRKIALRIFLFVTLLVIGVLVFIAYRMSQPPALLGIIPAEIKAAGFSDTRNIVKKTFEFGGLSFENIPFPEFLTEVFIPSDDLKEPGINLYSELVWFEHNDGFQVLMCKLARPDNWENYVTKKTKEGFFDSILSKEERHCIKLKNQNAFFAWRGKILCFVFTKNEALEIIPGMTDKILYPAKTFKILNKAYKKQKPDIFYFDVENNTSISIRLQSGLLRFYAQSGENEVEFSEFENINVANKNTSDTSILRIDLAHSEEVAKLFKEYSYLSGLHFPGLNLKVEIKYFHQNDSSEPVVRYQSHPSDFDMSSSVHSQIKNEAFIVADMGKSNPGILDQLTGLNLKHQSFDRIILAVSQQGTQQIWQGTIYMKDKQELPLNEAGNILVEWLFPGMKFNGSPDFSRKGR